EGTLAVVRVDQCRRRNYAGEEEFPECSFSVCYLCRGKKKTNQEQRDHDSMGKPGSFVLGHIVAMPDGVRETAGKYRQVFTEPRKEDMRLCLEILPREGVQLSGNGRLVILQEFSLLGELNWTAVPDCSNCESANYIRKVAASPSLIGAIGFLQHRIEPKHG